KGFGQDLGALAGAGFGQCHEDCRMPIKGLILPARCETKQAAQGGGLFFYCSPAAGVAAGKGLSLLYSQCPSGGGRLLGQDQLQHTAFVRGLSLVLVDVLSQSK